MATETHDTNRKSTISEKRAKADAIEELADRLRNADSIAEEAPVFAEMFIKARTSEQNQRDGRYVAQLIHDDVDGWDCRSVVFMESGTRYGQTPADVIVSHKPEPFLTVEGFGRCVADQLDREAVRLRQTAEKIEYDQQRIKVPETAEWA